MTCLASRAPQTRPAQLNSSQAAGSLPPLLGSGDASLGVAVWGPWALEGDGWRAGDGAECGAGREDAFGAEDWQLARMWWTDGCAEAWQNDAHGMLETQWRPFDWAVVSWPEWFAGPALWVG